MHAFKNDKSCCPHALLSTRTTCGPCWRAVHETRVSPNQQTTIYTNYWRVRFVLSHIFTSLLEFFSVNSLTRLIFRLELLADPLGEEAANVQDEVRVPFLSYLKNGNFPVSLIISFSLP